MKFVRYGEKNKELPGVIDRDGLLRDLSDLVTDITPETLAPSSLERLKGINTDNLPIVNGNVRLGVPVKGIPKIMAVGQNYLNHILEMGYEPPTEPVIFNKAISSLTGPYDPMVKPKTSTKMDYEVELAAIFSTVAVNVSEEDALSHVAGYALFNDGSIADFSAVFLAAALSLLIIRAAPLPLKVSAA